jgi:hypothetical protein
MITTLTLDVAMPQQRRAEYFASWASLDEAARAYNLAHFAALGRDRKYFAEVAEDGTATFPAVPPGRYVFESKHYGKTQKFFIGEEANVDFAARATVEIPAQSDGPVLIGEFALQAK